MKISNDLEEILSACISDNKQVYIAPTPICIADENVCGLNEEEIKHLLTALNGYEGDIYILEKFEVIEEAELKFRAKDNGLEYPKEDLSEGVM